MTTGSELFGQVSRLTGFDAASVPGDGVAVRIAGAPGTGVSELVAACRIVDPTVTVLDGAGVDETVIDGRAAGGAEQVRRPSAVGHRQAGHAEVGLGVLVVDPSTPVGDTERRIVDDLRSRYGAVGLVCTKIDAFWDWPRILRAQRQVLDPHGRLPVFAVSALAATSGAVEESGVVELVDWMREHLSAPADLRRARARVAAAQGAVEHRLAGIESASTAADRGPDIERLLDRRRVLVDGRDRGRGDRLASLRAGLASARSHGLADAQAGVRSIGATAATRCAALTRAQVDEHVAWLRSAITDLRDRVDDTTDDRIEQARAAALVGIEGADLAGDDPATGVHYPVGVEPVHSAQDHSGQDHAGQVDVGDVADPMEFERAIPTGRRGAEDALLVVIGASTGLGIGRLIVAPMSAVQTLQWVSMPLTLVLGVAVAAWVIRVRRIGAFRADLRSWSLDVLAEGRTRIEHRVGARVAAVEPQVAGQLARHHDRRTRRLAAEISDLDERVRTLRSGAKDPAAARALLDVRALDEQLATYAGALAGTDDV
ncbi:hypothetical protein [Gordonia soli]|uniref:G domain-containing protein n=1 Tax=Gordonia soli NBRC 108243 TaxID=1223545 RepID=M0QF23_9ACTN|nr:hypothetical protein [Gordonia soli]GAC67210.1 hypothetical protein GS4_06_00560 [Gordonia soli NBRC 108243]